jgi:hypothetical protein
MRPIAWMRGAIAGAPALRDAIAVSAGLVLLIVVGSGFLRWLDPALLGYLGATFAAVFGIAYQTSAFWRRPAAAFYGGALLAALRAPRTARAVFGGAARHLGAQELIARRARTKWIAHLLLSFGTLTSFAITLPLVFGWLHFEAHDPATYRAVFFNLPVATFATDGPLGTVAFHALSAAAVAVILGAGFFLLARVRRTAEPGAAAPGHVAPLLLLLAVAASGLALPATRTLPRAHGVAAVVHQLTVALLLVGLPFGKLGHLFIRPLHLGVLAMRAEAAVQSCAECAAALASARQLAAVEQLLAARGLAGAAHRRLCPTCRRRSLAAAQAQLVGADFHPRICGARPAPPARAEAA